jgi:TPR repeat protein
VDPDAAKQRYWTAELKYFDRLFEMAGGSYLPIDDLQRQAVAGDLQAQYQLGRQLLIAGPAGERQKGLQWIERAAEGGYAEAQYRLAKDYRQSQKWYQKLLQAYESGKYLGDVDDRFISFQRRRLEYVSTKR